MVDKESHQIDRDFRKLYPNLSDEELLEAQQKFDCYIEHAWKMFERMEEIEPDIRTLSGGFEISCKALAEFGGGKTDRGRKAKIRVIVLVGTKVARVNEMTDEKIRWFSYVFALTPCAFTARN
jgi:hypothetical protein